MRDETDQQCRVGVSGTEESNGRNIIGECVKLVCVYVQCLLL